MKKITVKLTPTPRVKKAKAIEAIQNSIQEVKDGVYSF